MQRCQPDTDEAGVAVESQRGGEYSAWSGYNTFAGFTATFINCECSVYPLDRLLL